MPAAKTTRRIRKRPDPDAAHDFVHVEERLLAAIERLLQDGRKFGSLTVEQLAREAGIGRATFYLYFRDKGELVQRLMRRLTDEVAQSAGGWFRAGGDVDRTSMKSALYGIIGTFKRHQAVLVAMTDTAPFDPVVAEAHATMMDELCKLSRKAIAQVRRDERATSFAGADLADLLTWSIELYCSRFIARYDGKRLDALIDLVAQVCDRAIFAGAE